MTEERKLLSPRKKKLIFLFPFFLRSFKIEKRKKHIICRSIITVIPLNIGIEPVVKVEAEWDVGYMMYGSW
jgi:hypothetical protein